MLTGPVDMVLLQDHIFSCSQALPWLHMDQRRRFVSLHVQSALIDGIQRGSLDLSGWNPLTFLVSSIYRPWTLISTPPSGVAINMHRPTQCHARSEGGRNSISAASYIGGVDSECSSITFHTCSACRKFQRLPSHAGDATSNFRARRGTFRGVYMNLFIWIACKAIPNFDYWRHGLAR